MQTYSRDMINLSDVPLAIFQFAGEKRKPPSYVELWTAVKNGSLGDAVVKCGVDRYFVHRADLPRVAQHFGIRKTALEEPKPQLSRAAKPQLTQAPKPKLSAATKPRLHKGRRVYAEHE